MIEQGEIDRRVRNAKRRKSRAKMKAAGRKLTAEVKRKAMCAAKKAFERAEKAYWSAEWWEQEGQTIIEQADLEIEHLTKNPEFILDWPGTGHISAGFYRLSSVEWFSGKDLRGRQAEPNMLRVWLCHVGGMGYMRKHFDWREGAPLPAELREALIPALKDPKAGHWGLKMRGLLIQQRAKPAA